MKKITLLLSVATLLTSCSKVKELEDRTKNMEETMEKMQNTTEQMRNTTNEMSATTENLDGNSASTYLQMRQKEAWDTRGKELEILRDPKTDMGQKLTAGKKYFYAFEFQLWSGIGYDDEEYREALITKAVSEFYNLLQDYGNDFIATSPTQLENASTSTKLYYALATTMHFKNSHQISNLKLYNKWKKKNLEEVSIYDIIESALQKSQSDEKAVTLTSYEQVVLGENIKITETLLNARLNFITILGLKDMITKDNMGYQDMARGAWYRITRGRGGSLNLDSTYEVQNIYTQDDIKEKLDGAIKTKKILDENGLRSRLDKGIWSIIKHLKKPIRSDDAQNQEDLEAYEMLNTIAK